MKEKLKTRSTEIKKPLVEYKITNINLYITESWFSNVFTATVPEVERIKEKNIGKVQKFTDIFSKR